MTFGKKNLVVKICCTAQNNPCLITGYPVFNGSTGKSTLPTNTSKLMADL